MDFVLERVVPFKVLDGASSKGTSLVIAEDSFFVPLVTLLPSLFDPLPAVGDSDMRY